MRASVVVGRATEAGRQAPLVALMLCHVSDHADAVDRTIAFGSRDLDAPAIPSATVRWPPSAVRGAAADDRMGRDHVTGEPYGPERRGRGCCDVPD